MKHRCEKVEYAPDGYIVLPDPPACDTAGEWVCAHCLVPLAVIAATASLLSGCLFRPSDWPRVSEYNHAVKRMVVREATAEEVARLRKTADELRNIPASEFPPGPKL